MERMKKMSYLLCLLLFIFSSLSVFGEEPAVKYVMLDDGHRVWTKRVGSGIPILILNGGPGTSHEYLKIIADILPVHGYQIIFYDQLGSGLSDKPNDPSLWNLDRFVNELEQVRHSLSLDQFYLYGHSWGGLLAIEYALKYQSHLRGLIVSNMSASVPSFIRYLAQLRKQLPSDVQQTLTYFESKGDYHNPMYERTIYEKMDTMNFCRLDPLPEFLDKAFEDTNVQVYETMQGPNEYVVIGNLKNWDRWNDIHKITVPTLVLGAKYDIMDPQDILRMGKLFPNGQAYILEKGSHLAMYDDTNMYFFYLLSFLDRIEFEIREKK